MFALAFSHFYEVCERSTESALDCRPCIFGIQRFFRGTHHTGRLQDGGRPDQPQWVLPTLPVETTIGRACWNDWPAV